MGELFPMILEKDEVALRNVDDAIEKLVMFKQLLLKRFIPREARPEKWDRIDGGVLVLDVPEVLKCPLSRKRFIDPVVIASGHTVERKEMEERLRRGIRTCPMTGEPLSHTHLQPNRSLREVIELWLDANGHEAPTYEDSDDRVCANADQIFLRMELERIPYSLANEAESEPLRSVGILTSRKTEFRTYFSNYPACVPCLLSFLQLERGEISHHVEEDLLGLFVNISHDPSVRKVIMECENGAPLIMEALRKGTALARSNAAWVLFMLAEDETHSILLGERGALRPLIELLEDGHAGTIKEAAMAVARLCEVPQNRERAVNENVVGVIMKKIRARFLQEELFLILGMLLNHSRAMEEMRAHGALSLLREVEREIAAGENGRRCNGVLYSLACYEHRKWRRSRGKVAATPGSNTVTPMLSPLSVHTPSSFASPASSSPVTGPLRRDKGFMDTIKKAIAGKKE